MLNTVYLYPMDSLRIIIKYISYKSKWTFLGNLCRFLIIFIKQIVLLIIRKNERLKYVIGSKMY